MSLQSRLDALQDRLKTVFNFTQEELAEYDGIKVLLHAASSSEHPPLIECLDDGFIRLVKHMASDHDIVEAARIAYGTGTRHTSEDSHLIRYLLRHRHTTPFEMCEFKFHVRVPMDCWRQWIRHRTANVNEYSTRYSEAIDSQQKTDSDKWRLQSKTNKQGSSNFVTEWPEGMLSTPNNEGKRDVYLDDGPRPYKEGATPGQYLSVQEKQFLEQARNVYTSRLKMGVAREQARKDLPLSTYTEAYWKCDLHNIFHFLGLRMDSHAQTEIAEYANAMFKLIQHICPIACQAFKDYRLNAITLSAEEIAWIADYDRSKINLSKRERAELAKKLSLLKIESRGDPLDYPMNRDTTYG